MSDFYIEIAFTFHLAWSRSVFRHLNGCMITHSPVTHLHSTNSEAGLEQSHWRYASPGIENMSPGNVYLLVCVLLFLVCRALLHGGGS